MKIRLVLGIVILLGLFIAVACSGKSAPTPAPTPTPNPAEQKRELLEKLADSGKEGYDTSTFLFDMRRQEGYDKLVFLSDNLTKPLMAVFFDKEEKVMGYVPILGFVFNGKITIPSPWVLFAGSASPPENYKGFQIFAVPEETPLVKDKGLYVDQKYGLHTFGLPPELKFSGVSELPRGNLPQLKSLDAAFIGIGGGDFVPGTVFSVPDQSDQKGLVVVSHQGPVIGGGLVFALKNGAPEVIGVVIKSLDNGTILVLDVDIVLSQKPSQ